MNSFQICNIPFIMFWTDIARSLQYLKNLSNSFINILAILQHFNGIFLKYFLNITVLCGTYSIQVDSNQFHKKLWRFKNQKLRIDNEEAKCGGKPCFNSDRFYFSEWWNIFGKMQILVYYYIIDWRRTCKYSWKFLAVTENVSRLYCNAWRMMNIELTNWK